MVRFQVEFLVWGLQAQGWYSFFLNLETTVLSFSKTEFKPRHETNFGALLMTQASRCYGNFTL